MAKWIFENAPKHWKQVMLQMTRFTKGDGVSLSDGDSECKSSPKKIEDNQDKYNGHGCSKSFFDYKKHNHVI